MKKGILILIALVIWVLNSNNVFASCSATPLNGTITSAPGTGQYFVSGTLTINGNITFTACTLFMDVDAKIIISQYRDVIFQSNCRIESCDLINMWDKITVGDGASLDMSDTYISDAKCAIDIHNNLGTWRFRSM